MAVNGYKCVSPVSPAMNLCQDGKNASLCSKVMFKNNDNSLK